MHEFKDSQNHLFQEKPEIYYSQK